MFIPNNMIDETRLWVAGGEGDGSKRRKTVAHLTQITYKKGPATPVVDEDIIRRPHLVKHCTAEACAAVTADPADSFGLSPSTPFRPRARYFGSLFTCDSHTVNRKLAKHIAGSI